MGAEIRGVDLRAVTDAEFAAIHRAWNDHSVLVFRGPSPQPAESFAQADPYVLNGLVKRWRVRPWNTVVGDGATLPT